MARPDRHGPRATCSAAPAEPLAELLTAELQRPLPRPIELIAATARRSLAPNSGAVQAVLVYGSCLRDGHTEDRLVDLYLLVDDAGGLPGGALLRLLGRLLPPNVYYLERPGEAGGQSIRAKCAVMTAPAFARLTGEGTFQSYFWARFAQPSALGYVRDAACRDRVLAALAAAARTTARRSLPLLGETANARTLWTRAFTETYRCELRAEPAGRAAELVARDAARYGRVTRALGLTADDDPDRPFKPPGIGRAAALRARLAWLARRWSGKALSVLRLLKAAFTFRNGADYLLWKIERHSGVALELTPWQRRHPILASSVLFWRLYRRGGFR